MLESRIHLNPGLNLKSLWLKDPYDLVPKALFCWESSVDPRYMDFCEVDSSALHPTTQKELWNKRWVLIYLCWLACKVVVVARLGGECSLAVYC